MTQGNHIRPNITLLSDDEIVLIHQNALKILSEVGVRFDSERGIQILGRADGIKVDENGIATFGPEVVAWAIEVAPSVVDIYSRDGELAFHLGADRMRFGIGVTALYYQDPESGELSKFSREHTTQMIRLGNLLPNFDVISTPGIIQDYLQDIADLYSVLELTANTTKPQVILVSEEELFNPALDLLEYLHGDLSGRPFILPYLNPISPLVVNTGTVDKIIASSERGLPFIYNTYGMAGLSAPITPAGMLAQMTAELLAGLVFSQLVKEGTPIILGMLPAYFDMKTMANFYDPQSYLISLGCAEMMRYYHLPHSGTSGSGNGWSGDLIDVENYWFNHLVLLMGKAGLAPFVGDTLVSKVFSPLNVVYCNEVIGKLLVFSQGLRLDEEIFGIDEIADQGPGGNFLMSPLTLRYFKQAYTESKIFPHYTMESWQQVGQPKPRKLLQVYTRAMIESLQEPEDFDEILAKGEAFIKDL